MRRQNGAPRSLLMLAARERQRRCNQRNPIPLGVIKHSSKKQKAGGLRNQEKINRGANVLYRRTIRRTIRRRTVSSHRRKKLQPRGTTRPDQTRTPPYAQLNSSERRRREEKRREPPSGRGGRTKQPYRCTVYVPKNDPKNWRTVPRTVTSRCVKPIEPCRGSHGAAPPPRRGGAGGNEPKTEPEPEPEPLPV